MAAAEALYATTQPLVDASGRKLRPEVPNERLQAELHRFKENYRGPEAELNQLLPGGLWTQIDILIGALGRIQPDGTFK